MLTEDFNVRLVEDVKSYTPDPQYRKNAWMEDYQKAYADFLKDPDAFWEKMAKELDWIRQWDAVKEWNYPYAKWFTNAKLNISANCLDRHVNNSRRNKVALIWKGEEGRERIFTYQKLLSQVARFANALRKIGVKKGDCVCIYMPLVPEQVIAMLACARIGAVHNVVFGGFGAAALNMRIHDAEAKVVITADISIRRGKAIQLKAIVDEAVINAPTVEHVIVLRRREPQLDLHERELDFYEMMEGLSDICQPEIMDAEDPFFILYTSGSTGKPKGIVHTCGGYMVGTYYTSKYVFDLKDEDIYWCTADPGWITGHSYIVYGPLLNGATSFMYEGAPAYPFPNRWWQMIERYGINILYTAPTAIRGLMRFGEAWPNRHDLSSLRLLGSVGEPINPEAWKWYHRVIGRGQCPIMDTWWQTETGMFMITPTPVVPLKPGSGTRPFPGLKMDIYNEEGKPVGPNEEGFLVIKTPWPAMMRTIYKDPDRYVNQYWSKFPGVYLTGDSAKRDEDGYYWIIGRVDDVIKVSGYRLGTAEIESALGSHPAVVEAAAIGLPHEVKGNAIYAYVILKTGIEKSEKLIEELRHHVSHEMGPIAKPEHIEFVESLPKTRSGKIMRRVLKARAMGQEPKDIMTLEE